MYKQDIKKILGTVLRELRMAKGLTQEQLAEYLEVQTHTVNRIETGRNFVSSELLTKLCDYFDVAPAVFFTQKPEIMIDKHINLIKEIVRLLPAFSTEKLSEILNILLVMKK